MIRFSAVLVGVLLITVAIVLGPLYTASGYSIVTNLVSELGAQHMPNAWIMNAGFIAFGVGVTVSAARRAHSGDVPRIWHGHGARGRVFPPTSRPLHAL